MLNVIVYAIRHYAQTGQLTGIPIIDDIIADYHGLTRMHKKEK